MHRQFRIVFLSIPAILVGVLLNIFDAASLGVLVFPQDSSVFNDIQVHGVAIFLMSTVISQLTLSIRGSQFEGAMGSMLVEVLPMMRDIASKLQKAVGSDSLDLLPTVLVAYTMASILIGLCFLILGTLKLD